MRGAILAFVLGATALQSLPALPSGGQALSLFCAGLGLAVMARRSSVGSARVLWAVAGCCLGLWWAAERAQLRLQDRLAPSHVDAVSRVVLQVADLPQRTAHGWRFEAKVLERPPGVPTHVLVVWPAQPAPAPGQVWRAALRLRPPYGTRNPGLFDYEAHLFARGILAVGALRGTPVALPTATAPWSFSVVIARIRAHARAQMQAALAQRPYGEVMIALAIGDQSGVAAADWQRFNRAGITHLVSISGAHVTLLAGLGAGIAMRAWRRGRWRGRGLAERWPARCVGACMAVCLAGAYCLLAGWGIPAQRTFIMLAITVAAVLARLPLARSDVLALAALVVVVCDPWSTLAAGFWLSFAAVAVLMAWVTQPPMEGATRWRRWGRALGHAAALQWAMTLALMPLLAWQFQQLPLLSPLANAIAIPVVGGLVTPLAVFGAVIMWLPGADGLGALLLQLGAGVFAGVMQVVQRLADVPWATLAVAAPSWVGLFAALVGVAWALRSPGWPLRQAGWLLMLPMLLWRPVRPAEGEWRIHALDVGQGAAVLIETRRGLTLFDTGLRYHAQADVGERIIWPAVRALGWRRLEELVLSHADLDHAGGLLGVLSHLPVGRIMSSFDLLSWAAREPRLLVAVQQASAVTAPQPCAPGLSWVRDGVRFRFLHPPPSPQATHPWRRGRNEDSCVLKIEGRHHRALLLGDIGAIQERALLAQGEAQADWVALAHHGSRTSSAPAFVRATGARHVVAQMGPWNRYQHPHPAVVQRWQAVGATVWRSDHHGAVVAHSRASGLSVWAERQRRPRYWQYAWPAAAPQP